MKNKLIILCFCLVIFVANAQTEIQRPNIVYGPGAGQNTTSGYDNVAVGNGALNKNTTGAGNIAIGYNALNNNNNAYDNIAIGADALYFNTTGYKNVANGNSALFSNQVGFQNTANGDEALYNNFGNQNTANGAYALNSNNFGNYNTAVGYGTSYNNTAGNYNTAIGYQAGGNLQNVRTNTTCIGNGAGFVTTNNNQINIGNASVTNIAGQVGWSTYSDKRIKNNIQYNVPGLAFISKLKPVTYNLDIRKQYEIANNGLEDTSADYEGKYDIEKIKMTGFLAQDVEQASKDSNYDFSGVTAPKDGKGLYSLRYSEFVVPLVKAVQELNQKVQQQNTEIEQLKKDNQEMKKLLKSLLKKK